MGISYEWDVEEVDEYGDVQDHNFMSSILEYAGPVIDSKTYHLVLVRNSGNNDEGLIDRAWAYAEIVDGKLTLPKTFDNGKNVPERFHEELRKANIGW